jgi:putative Mg2+ transporter-C (MgtC) family protein
MVGISTEFIIRLCVAALLGGVLGLEREIHGRPAGFRTHLLVSLGAAAFMLLSPIVAGMGQGVPADPGRIVTGIGFLGAGAIVKEGITVRGLTTAACLWVAAAIGMTTGAGSYTGAVIISLIALFALEVLPVVETLIKKHSYWVLEITTPLEADMSAIVGTVVEQDVVVLRQDMERDYSTGTLKITFLLRLFHDKAAHQIVKAIEDLGVSPRRISWHPR